MTYMLTVTRNEPNPKYGSQLAPYHERETPLITTQVLSMEITAKQFERIRAAALQEAK